MPGAKEGFPEAAVQKLRSERHAGGNLVDSVEGGAATSTGSHGAETQIWNENGQLGSTGGQGEGGGARRCEVGAPQAVLLL